MLSLIPFRDPFWSHWTHALPIVDVPLPLYRSETADHVEYQVDMPGLDKEQIELEILGRRLTIRAVRGDAEYSTGTTLPFKADVSSIKSSLDKGVLTIRVPKPAEEKPRKITIG